MYLLKKELKIREEMNDKREKELIITYLVPVEEKIKDEGRNE